MPESKAYDLMDFGGGFNDSLPGHRIEDSQLRELINWYTDGPVLRRRPRLAYVTETAFGEMVTALFAMKEALGEWTLLAGTETGIAKKVGLTLQAIPIKDGASFTSSTKPWAMRQRNNIVYACRELTGTLKRVTPSAIMDAGIAAPSAGPTLADGDAGDILADDYYAVVTFYNSTTGAESNPSPVS